MKAIIYSQFGEASDVLTLVEREVFSPGPGEVLVSLKASGANPSDVRARRGGRPGITKPPFPEIIPHSDGAGIIEAVGEGVDPARIGERVWIWNGQWQRAFGTASEMIALPSIQAVRLPDNLSFEEGAILGIPGLTAAHGVLAYGDISGKTVMISGGAGTVGRLAVQMAKAGGATVVSTAHGEASIQSVKDAGADIVLDYKSSDLATEIMEATSGHGVDYVFEQEFGRNIQTISDVIRPMGKIVTIGSAQDMTPTLPFYPLLFKSVSIDILLVYLLEETLRKNSIDRLTSILETGKIAFDYQTIAGLENTALAHDTVANKTKSGAVIITV